MATVKHVLLAGLVAVAAAAVTDKDIKNSAKESIPVYHTLASKKNTCSVNSKCEAYPRTCKDVRAGNLIYMLATMDDMMEMMCEMHTLGGGWTVIQKRQHGDVDFYRGWEDYKYGFGQYGGDFWFGLEKIHQMTTKGKYELYVSFDFKGKAYYARYSSFCVLGEKEDYRLFVDGYSGNAGDSLSIHNGVVFSTKDNDKTKQNNKNCTQKYKGGWWYKVCHRVNFNGIWGDKSFGVGLNWEATTTYDDTATNVQMMIRKLH